MMSSLQPMTIVNRRPKDFIMYFFYDMYTKYGTCDRSYKKMVRLHWALQIQVWDDNMQYVVGSMNKMYFIDYYFTYKLERRALQFGKHATIQT